jgi:hypothetical protein
VKYFLYVRGRVGKSSLALPQFCSSQLSRGIPLVVKVQQREENGQNQEQNETDDRLQ